MLQRADEDHQQLGLIRGEVPSGWPNEGKALPQDQSQAKQLIINLSPRPRRAKFLNAFTELVC